MNKYIPTIGLEIHAELKTKSKMFCSCKNNPFNAKQNENICPVCLGMPGTLPVLNHQAIEWTIMTGLALNAEISKFTKWDRKNYFYPDLPKGYQISQYDLPIVIGGYIKLKTNNEKLKTIRITRIHLEEDTGTSKHPEGREGVNYSLLDYNRAGVPLMELVTEPDISSGKEAKEFCQKYQMILRALKVADADMEKGQMRCEVNISLRENSKLKTKNSKLGTKVEIKNLNSFKAVEMAIDYEIKRQTEILEEGGEIIQETRGWDDIKGKTYSMRVKETSADYRYFPEPDLPPVVIIKNSKLKNQSHNLKFKTIDIEKIKKQLPELPDEKIKKYISQFKIPSKDANILVINIKKDEKFQSILKNKQFNIKNAQKIANILINEPLAISIKEEYLIELVDLLQKNIISSKILKEILPVVKNENKSPNEIIKEKGLEQISNTGELEKIIDQVIKKNQDAVSKIKNGNMGVMGFMVGQVMRQTKGKANPQIVNEVLRKKLK